MPTITWNTELFNDIECKKNVGTSFPSLFIQFISGISCYINKFTEVQDKTIIIIF